MQKPQAFYACLLSVFLSLPLYATKNGPDSDDIVPGPSAQTSYTRVSAKDEGIKSLRKKQKRAPYQREDDEGTGCNFLCCPPFYSLIKSFFIADHLNQDNLMRHDNLISRLPNELILYVCDFLDSPSLLRLSGTDAQFRQLFDGGFWLRYLSKLPKAASCLTLTRPLSPTLQRPAFFSHLWYTQGNFSLAAQLSHPEAKALVLYASYGFRLRKDQYIVASEIRDTDGKINIKATKALGDAVKKKGASIQIDYVSCTFPELHSLPARSFHMF